MDANHAKLVAQHAAFPRALEHLIDGVETRLLRTREVEGRWSPLEILAHIADEEIEDFRPRAQAAAAGKPVPWAIDPQGWVRERAYNEKDPTEVLQGFASEREASCEWLAQLTPEQLAAALDHPQLGHMRCGDFVAAWRMHDLLHLRQLTTALAVLTSRGLSSWRIEYAGRIPSGE